jgi:hypothetical protein
MSEVADFSEAFDGAQEGELCEIATGTCPNGVATRDLGCSQTWALP